MPISKINNIPIGVGHSHSNKGVLDSTTASFTLADTRNGVSALKYIDPVYYDAILNRTDSGVDHSIALMDAKREAKALGAPVIFPEGTFNVGGAEQIHFDDVSVYGFGQASVYNSVEHTTTIQWIGAEGGSVVRLDGTSKKFLGFHVNAGLPGQPKAHKAIEFYGQIKGCDFALSSKGGTRVGISCRSPIWAANTNALGGVNNGGNRYYYLRAEQTLVDVGFKDTVVNRIITGTSTGSNLFVLSNVTGLNVFDWLILDATNLSGTNYWGTVENAYSDAKIFQIKSIDSNTGAIEVFENYYADKLGLLFPTQYGARITKYPHDGVTTGSIARLAAGGIGHIPQGHHDWCQYLCVAMYGINKGIVFIDGDQNYYDNITVESAYLIEPIDLENQSTLSVGINPTIEEITVDDASKFPDLADCSSWFESYPWFFIWVTQTNYASGVSTEVMRVTAVNGNTLTVQRNYQYGRTHAFDNYIQSSALSFSAGAKVTPFLGWNHDSTKNPLSSSRHCEGLLVTGRGDHPRLQEWFGEDETVVGTSSGINGNIVNILTIGQLGGAWHIGCSVSGVKGVKYLHLDHQHSHCRIQVDDSYVQVDLDLPGNLNAKSTQIWQDEFGFHSRINGSQAVFGEHMEEQDGAPQAYGASYRPPIEGYAGYSPPGWWARRRARTGESVRITNESDMEHLILELPESKLADFPCTEITFKINRATKSLELSSRKRLTYATYEDGVTYPWSFNIGAGGTIQEINTTLPDVVMNWNNWNHGYLLLDTDINGITFIDSTNTSQAGTIQIFQDAVGGRSLSGWDPAIQWVNASEPIMPSPPEEGIICSFIYNGIRGVYIGSWSLLQ